MKKYYLDFENTNHLSLFTRGSAFRKYYIFPPFSLTRFSLFPSFHSFKQKVDAILVGKLLTVRLFSYLDSGFLAPLKRAWTREISTTGSLDLQAHGILIDLESENSINVDFGFRKSDCVVNFRWLLVLYDFERGFQEAVPVKINLWAIFIIKKITSDQMRME
ncbi:hypothetical protein RhiirB3_393111 [Rhizophagus irregularis]|nr:hypothetical protein RhiirB3_393111 [Rhizophagus irregularis]